MITAVLEHAGDDVDDVRREVRRGDGDRGQLDLALAGPAPAAGRRHCRGARSWPRSPLPAARPRRRAAQPAPAGDAGAAAGGVHRGRRLSRLHAVDGAAVVHQLEAAADARLRRPRAVRAPVRQRRASWSRSQNIVDLRRRCSSLGCLVLGFLLAVFIDQRVRAEGVFRTIFLYPLRDVASSSPASSGSGSSTRRSASRSWCATAGFESFTFDWLVEPADGDLHAGDRRRLARPPGLVMAILLAGLRGVDADLWKAARVDGIPTWRVYLSIVLPLLGPMIVTATVLLAIAVVKALRPRRRHDPRRPGHRLRGAGQVRHGPPVRAQQYRARHGRRDHHAGHRDRRAGALALCPVRAGREAAARDERRQRADRRAAGRATLTCGPDRRLRLPGRRGAVLPAAALDHARDLAQDRWTRSGSATSSPGPSELTIEPWIDGLVRGLHRARLRRHQRRLLELGADPDPVA